MLKQLCPLMWCSTLIQGSDLRIEVYKKHSRRRKVARLGITPRVDPMCKASIKFDDLWQHLVYADRSQMWAKFCVHHSQFTQSTSAKFKVEFDNLIQGLQLWLVIEVRYHYCCHADSLYKYDGRITALTWHTGSTDQECDGGIEQVPVCFESSWFHKRCCRNVYGIREGDQRGNWTLTSMHGCYLIQNSSILQQMAFFHASTLFIKSAVFHLSMIAVQLIDFPASQGSRRSSQRNYRPCGEHQSPSWPAEKARGSPNIRRIVWYYQRVPRPDGKSGDSHSEVAEKLDV